VAACLVDQHVAVSARLVDRRGIESHGTFHGAFGWMLNPLPGLSRSPFALVDRRYRGAVHLLPRNSQIVLTNSAAVSVRTAFKAGSKIPMSDLRNILRNGCSINPSLAGSGSRMRASLFWGQSIECLILIDAIYQ
jgi:hypothetical protein